MKTRLSALALSAFFLSAPAFAAEQTVSLSVPGMFCASCPFIVEAAIGDVEGVTSVETSLEDRTALVVFDDEITSLDEITFATLEVGYESSLIEGDSSS